MKNKTLIPILIPTEDASPIVKFIGNIGKRMIVYEPTLAKREKDEQNQHLNLVSDAPIKDKDYFIWCGMLYQYGVDYKGDLGDGEQKVELSTDPKLTQCDGKCAKNECVCDLVPAIDGNTKALIINTDYYKVVNNGEKYNEVNFLEEFCKRYNQKDNKKVDVEKLSVGEIADEYAKNKGGITVEERNGFVNGFKSHQALQSNAGGFSLEDMRKAFAEGKEFEEAHSDKSHSQEYEDKMFNRFIQSLTKESQPKGDVVIELNDGKLIFK